MLGGDALGDPEALGLDAIYPAFFVALLIAEARSGARARRRGRRGGDRLRARPVAPPGVPVLVASLASLLGLVRRRMSAGTTWGLIAACAVITAAIKAIGPVALGGRELPAWFGAIVAMMAPALFAALVVTQALADGSDGRSAPTPPASRPPRWRPGAARR